MLFLVAVDFVVVVDFDVVDFDVVGFDVVDFVVDFVVSEGISIRERMLRLRRIPWQ